MRAYGQGFPTKCCQSALRSTQDCTDALARAAAVARPPESLAQYAKRVTADVAWGLTLGLPRSPLQIVEEKVKDVGLCRLILSSQARNWPLVKEFFTPLADPGPEKSEKESGPCVLHWDYMGGYRSLF